MSIKRRAELIAALPPSAFPKAAVWGLVLVDARK
jgi:hypothetical protein